MQQFWWIQCEIMILQTTELAYYMTSNYLFFSFVWKPPGGAVLFFTDSSCKIKVLLWFCSSDWIISCWGGCCSINQQRQLVSVDCIVMRHFRELSHSVVSGLNSHSRCSHTPSTNAIGHSVCGFSLHDSKKATATPSKHPPHGGHLQKS